MTTPRPYTLVAELTYRCPLRCLYCSNPTDFALTGTELTTGDWCAAFSQAADLGVVQVHLSGGEPVLRADLVDLVRHARGCDLYTNLITGGTLLDDAQLRRLRDAGLDHVQLSIQDSAAAPAEHVAGVRSHARKLAVARLIRQLEIPFTLNVVLHRLNIDRVASLIACAAELGAQRLELANTQFYAWALANRATLMPTREQYDRAERIVGEAIARHRSGMEIVFVMNDYLSGEPKPCMGGWGQRYICIDPTGRVLPCHAATVIPDLHFERVADRPLAAIWSDSPAINAFRGDHWMVEPCRSCPRKTIDFGGCRCQAFLLSGRAETADPICRLSPAHDTVARLRTDLRDDAPPLYRDARTSRRIGRQTGPPVP
jgi:pyrroloquinoline quinone biosynthesis protein E